MSAGFEKADTSSVSSEMPADTSLQTALFDAVCESLGAAFIVYDKTDHMIFASRQVLDFFPISPIMLQAGTRLRDFLGAIYDTGIRTQLGRQAGLRSAARIGCPRRSPRIGANASKPSSATAPITGSAFGKRRLPKRLRRLRHLRYLRGRRSARNSGAPISSACSLPRISSTICRSRSSSRTAI